MACSVMIALRECSGRWHPALTQRVPCPSARPASPPAQQPAATLGTKLRHSVRGRMVGAGEILSNRQGPRGCRSDVLRPPLRFAGRASARLGTGGGHAAAVRVLRMVGDVGDIGIVRRAKDEASAGVGVGVASGRRASWAGPSACTRTFVGPRTRVPLCGTFARAPTDGVCRRLRALPYR